MTDTLLPVLPMAITDEQLRLQPMRERIAVARAARAIGGLTLSLVLPVQLALIAMNDDRGSDAHPTRTIFIAWQTALVVALLVFLAGPRAPVARGIAKRLASDPRAGLLGSIAWPMIACCLAMPLTLHAAVAGLLGFSDQDLARWIVLSLGLTTHVHLVLAGLALADAVAMCKAAEPSIAGRGWRGVAWRCVLVSAAPGAILLGIPPLIVAVTGVAFAPLLWRWARGVIVRETAALG